MSGKIVKVSGPLVIADGLSDANMADVVRVGEQRLMGEILNMDGASAAIQVYEETSGLGPGTDVETTGHPLSVELGPGLLESIYDGIQRPLTEIMALSGSTIARGVDVPALNREKKWHFEPTKNEGDSVFPGDIIGTVQETEALEHRIMVPLNLTGTLVSISAGSYTVEDTVATIRTEDGNEHKVTMIQRWPVRRSRPYKQKFVPSEPLQSGQRVIDTMFPLAKGGNRHIRGVGNKYGSLHKGLACFRVGELRELH